MDITNKQLQHQKTLEVTAKQIAAMLERQDVVADLNRRQSGPKQDVLDSLLHRQQDAELVRRLASLHPADIAFVMEGMSLDKRDRLWDLIPESDRASVLLELSDSVRAALLDSLSMEQIESAASIMDATELSELIPHLPQEQALELLTKLDQSERRKVNSSLNFPEHSAGSLMDLEMVTVRENMTLKDVIEIIRQHQSTLELNDQVYVVDTNGHYRGSLSLKKILFQEHDEFVSNVMKNDGLTFFTDENADSVVSAFERYDLVSCPVLNIHNRLVGNISFNRVMDYLDDIREMDQLKSVGLNEEEIYTPPWQSARNRWLWLAMNLVAAFVASRVISLFEGTIEQIVALATLMPIVASISGNTGNQTIALMIRGLTLKQISKDNFRIFFRKEILVSLYNGCIWGAAVALFALFFYGNFNLSLLMFASMIVCLLISAVAGSLIPYLLSRSKRDPVMGSSVLLTAVTDSMGFLVFLGMASLFLL